MPLTCQPPEPDCALIGARINGSDEGFRRAVVRAVLMERRTGPDLAALIRAEALTSRRPIAALPPAPEPVSLPILDYVKQKGATP